MKVSQGEMEMQQKNMDVKEEGHEHRMEASLEGLRSWVKGTMELSVAKTEFNHKVTEA
jgi:hypothetical protein